MASSTPGILLAAPSKARSLEAAAPRSSSMAPVWSPAMALSLLISRTASECADFASASSPSARWRASSRPRTCSLVIPSSDRGAGLGCDSEPHTGQGLPSTSPAASAPAVADSHRSWASRAAASATFAPRTASRSASDNPVREARSTSARRDASKRSSRRSSSARAAGTEAASARIASSPACALSIWEGRTLAASSQARRRSAADASSASRAATRWTRPGRAASTAASPSRAAARWDAARAAPRHSGHDADASALLAGGSPSPPASRHRRATRRRAASRARTARSWASA